MTTEHRAGGFSVLSLNLLLLLFLGLSLAPVAHASIISEVPLCLHACQSSLRAVRFTDEDRGATQAARECHSLQHQTSLYLCTREHCEAGDRVEGLALLNATCEEDEGTALPPFEAVVGRYTDEDVERLERFDGTGQPGLEPTEGPALPTERAWKLWRDTLDATNHVYYHHFVYGWAMGLFWAGVIAIGMLNRLAWLYRTSGPGDHQASHWRPLNWVKGHVLVPATFGHRAAQSFGAWCTVPPRVQSLTIAGFFAINVVFSVHGYRFVDGNIYFPTLWQQVLRYVADRTGIISFANFPLIWLFGMRNNVVIWLTGWDFGTYNTFHRWVARVATLQAVIHSVAYSWLILAEGGWTYFAYWWTLLFWWSGELATILMCALLAFSFYWIRRKHYELFLIAHILLSALVLLCMLGHVSIFNGEYDALIWVPVAIWVLDRVLRTGRVLAFNYQLWNTKAQAVFNPATNMIRLHVPCSRSLYRVRSGMHFYLMVLSDAKFWESHPFTVASMSDRDDQSTAKTLGEDAPLLENEDRSVLPEESRTMSFLIRPYDSSTSRLRDLAAAAWPKPAAVRVMVDGPYGHTQPLHQYDNVIFIVGGSGIVVPLSYLKHLLANTSQTQKIHIHWAVRERAFAEDVVRQDFAAALESERLKVDIYLGHNSDPLTPETAGVSSSGRRMDVRSAVLATGAEVEGSASLAVVACGPANMADDARKATGDMIRSGRTGIDYFEESFQW